jgi:hypothetical protein
MWQIFIKNLILDIFIVNNVILIELKVFLGNIYYETIISRLIIKIFFPSENLNLKHYKLE